MKKFLPILTAAVLSMTVLASCDDLLYSDTDRQIADEEYGLQTPGDSIFSMFGLFTQLQKVADSYVLLGELRGDLLDITDLSDRSLREINDFNVTADNQYVDIRNYYAIINNCNYILTHLDTTLIDKGQKLQRGQYAAVKAIRAWTYMQMALNFKTVKYYDEPILTVADATKTFEELELEALAARLIPELESLQEVQLPSLGYIESYNTLYSFFPVKVVLGDLYLWTGQYEKAATAYRGAMFDRRLIINKEYYSHWIPVNNTISADAELDWQQVFTFSSNEIVTTIMCPTDYGQDYYLDTINNMGWIKPSAIALDNWDRQTYYLNEASNAQGDLRKYGSISYSEETDFEATTDYSFSGPTSNRQLIYKYKLYDQNVIIYRSSLLYLRYAEAVNRLGKPNLAFAVLKYGLNGTNLFNSTIVPAKERESPAPAYMQFGDVRFQNNAGIRMRGLGNAQNDTTFFKLPTQPTQLDSIRYVENLIQEELALETAFEGNRFHDLMRLTLRRMNDAGYNDDESYLADKVAAKHDGDAAIRAKLLNRDNWFIQP